MNITDHIAQEHSYLLDNIHLEEDNSQSVLSKVIEEPVIEEPEIAIYKEAACSTPFFERVFQGIDENYHQDDETKDFWKIQNNKLIRVVSKVVKG